MDTKKIKALLLAAEYKSLSKAAEVFSYTPSALSHSVDALEEELGVKLLVRTHTGVELSEEGKYLLDKLEAVAAAEKALVKAASELSGEKGKLLRIGTYASISVHLLPEVLKGFRQKYPDIRISIIVGDKLRGWLENDIADVLFAEAPKVGDGVFIPFVKDDFVAVVPSAMFAGRKTVSCEALCQYPFILVNDSSVRQHFTKENCKEIIDLTSVDDTSVVSMVREGIGVAVLPALVLKAHPKGVRMLKLDPPMSRTLGVTYRKDSGQSSCAMKFVNYLKSSF